MELGIIIYSIGPRGIDSVEAWESVGEVEVDVDVGDEANPSEDDSY
jgi:hypothetical protein